MTQTERSEVTVGTYGTGFDPEGIFIDGVVIAVEGDTIIVRSEGEEYSVTPAHEEATGTWKWFSN